MDKVLVLAGGLPQIDLILQLQKKNYFVLLADYNENPVAKKYADKFYQVSTLDVDAIKEVAQKENVKFLITVCTDQALLTVSKVSQELGLPCYINYETGLKVTNKQYMKDIFAKNDIPTADYLIVDKYDKYQFANKKFPLIVKPVDCNSSKGVKKVCDFCQLELAINDAIKLSRTKTAVVESFIEGTEISVDVYVENGHANVLSISKLEKLPENGKFIIFRSIASCNLVVRVDEIQKVVQSIADAFMLKNSPMLIQMIVGENGVFVLEFSARTGGGEKFITIKKQTGFDVINAVIELTEGKYPHYKKIKSEKTYCVSEFIYCKKGIFKEVEGCDELLNNKIIDDFMLFKWKGAEFDGIFSSGDRIAGFVISGSSLGELNQKHLVANKTLKIISQTNEDIMRHDLLTEIESV